MNVISVKQIAFFAISLWFNKPSDKLNKHFVKNFEKYQKAIKKAEKSSLEIPKRARKEDVRSLSLQLNELLGNPKGWSEVHWRILSYLLIFTSQIRRKEQKSIETGKRWIHIEAHILAIKFAKEVDAMDAPAILAFLKPKEVNKLSNAIDIVKAGSSYSQTVQNTNLSPHGLRESLRCFLEYDEREEGIPPATEEVMRYSLNRAAKNWNKEIDPEASLVRVRGIIHEDILRKKMLEIIKLERVSSALVSSSPSNSKIEKKLKENELRITKKRIHKDIKIEPLTFELGCGSVIALFSFILLFIIIPKPILLYGVAWWYFTTGLSGLLVVHYIVKIFKWNEKPPEINIQDLIVIGGIVSFLLIMIKKDTFHFGIAWWHSILGVAIGIIFLNVIIPYVRSFCTKEGVVVRTS